MERVEISGDTEMSALTGESVTAVAVDCIRGAESRIGKRSRVSTFAKEDSIDNTLSSAIMSCDGGLGVVLSAVLSF